MADLTVLSSSSSVPLYPLLSASRSSFFNNYVAGASSSKVNLATTQASSLEGRRPERPTRLNIQRNTYAEAEAELVEEEEDNQRLSPTTEDEEVESPQSYIAPNPNGGGWNRNDNSWRLDDPTSSTLTPTARGRTRIQQHRPTRSRSAPPIQTTFNTELSSSKPFTAAADHTAFDINRIRRYTSSSSYTESESGHSSPSSSFSNPPSYGFGYGYGNGKSKNGDLLRPPPPLHRPTTFWRRTPRSGVTASAYSPSSHLIRRSTFVAAGLPFERPMADLSALGVESRVKAQFDEDNARAKVSEVFWEVVVQR